MPRLSFALIRPTIARQETRGAILHVVFHCPASNVEVPAQARLARPSDDTASGPSDRPTSLFGGLRRSLSSLMRSMVGDGASQTGSDIPDLASRLAGDFPDQAQNEAALRAFKRVQSQFAWDADRGQFVSAALFPKLQTEFIRRVQAAPLREHVDQFMLARMLTEIAAADGSIADEEKDFFDAFAGTSVGSLGDLLLRPRLCDAELQETTPEIRENLIMLAFAVAYCDEDFDPAEGARINELAAGLSISPIDAEQLESLAKIFVVDQLFDAAYGDGVVHQAHVARVEAVAKRLGFSPESAAELDRVCRQRRGVE